MDVRYRCMGCGHKMATDEHMRNLTQEKFDLEGLTHTMTVILCDTCKPEYDRLRKEQKEGDVLDVVANLASTQNVITEEDAPNDKHMWQK